MRRLRLEVRKVEVVSTVVRIFRVEFLRGGSDIEKEFRKFGWGFLDLLLNINLSMCEVKFVRLGKEYVGSCKLKFLEIILRWEIFKFLLVRGDCVW